MIAPPGALFTVQLDTEQSDVQRLVHAFLILLAGEEHPDFKRAQTVLRELEDKPQYSAEAEFFRMGLELIPAEMSTKFQADPSLAQDAGQAVHHWTKLSRMKKLHILRKVFFPEGLGLDDATNRKKAVEKLREKRTVRITQFSAPAIRDPLKEILFTSNLLLTLPLSADPASWDAPQDLKETLKHIRTEPQKYWYDHPIPLGIGPEQNEALYGLQGLEEAVAYEKARGLLAASDVLHVALSASVTHDGLHSIARPYFEYVFGKYAHFRHLRLYIFTEQDTQRIIWEILLPLANYFRMEEESQTLYEIFGVDGEYGRHYSFLKAVGALWQVFVAPGLKATFKIDLDQVFDQKALEKETGRPAFQHFKTPVWGARGKDAAGKEVELGMIAGALVNQQDIQTSLFTPDVTFPEGADYAPDEWIFYSRLPQALSTEAEMMTRYNNPPDGRVSRVLQRVHVTGGTNGILIDALRRHRPFTPSVIGRAEDQAYLLSALFGHPPLLRYVHKDGLIMRHDKESFAREAIQAAALGKQVGDYMRILLFSYYARALPWDFSRIKGEIDPFTGCFVSQIPVTLAFLRAAFRALHSMAQGAPAQGEELIRLTARRVRPWLEKIAAGENPMLTVYRRERKGWDLFYDLLDRTQQSLDRGDGFAEEIRNRFAGILKDCRLNLKEDT